MSLLQVSFGISRVSLDLLCRPQIHDTYVVRPQQATPRALLQVSSVGLFRFMKVSCDLCRSLLVFLGLF